MGLDIKEKKAMKPLGSQAFFECALELKSLDAAGRFAGYASVFDVVDAQRDVVKRGAFLRTLAGRVGEIKLLWQHQMEEPIGFFTAMFEDAKGLYVEGQLMLELARAAEAHALLKAGVVSGLSIGYQPVRFATDPATGVRMLSEVELIEISLVTIPANDKSRVSVVKGRKYDDFDNLSDALSHAVRVLAE